MKSMRSNFQHFVFLLLLFGMFISCTEQENPGPEDGLIYHPFGNEIIYRSKTCRISWNTPSWTSLDIVLNNDSGLSWQICEELPNTDSYNWDIPKEIPDGTAYSLRVSNSENSQSAPAYTEPFEIRSQGEFSTLTDSRDGQVYRTIRNKPDIEAAFLGEKNLKNVDRRH